MFIGSYEHTIDVKGRMAVPSRFREQLGDVMYVTRWLDKCLALYPESEFKKISDKLAALSQVDVNARNFRRLFFSEATEVSPDKQGRINIAARLRQFAGINADDAQVIVVGVDNYIEIWALDAWNEAQEAAEQNVDSMAESLAKLGVF